MFPSIECDGTSHIIDGKYSKCMTILFISEAMDWCCDKGCKFLTDDESFLLMPMSGQEEKSNKTACTKET